MTRVETLRVQLTASLMRLGDLQRRAEKVAAREAHLPRAVEELERALQELQVACEELRLQNERLETARSEADSERNRWKAMFEAAPLPYLLTDSQGIIRAANEAASERIAISRKFLVGKSLATFVNGGRVEFVSFMEEVRSNPRPASIAFDLRPREHAPSPVTADVHPFPLHDGSPGLWWVLRDESGQRV